MIFICYDSKRHKPCQRNTIFIRLILFQRVNFLRYFEARWSFRRTITHVGSDRFHFSFVNIYGHIHKQTRTHTYMYFAVNKKICFTYIFYIYIYIYTIVCKSIHCSRLFSLFFLIYHAKFDLMIFISSINANKTISKLIIKRNPLRSENSRLV